MRGLPLFHLHNVIAEVGLHNVDLANLLREDRIVERRHHLAALRKSQLAACVLAARVVGVFLRQIGPASAGLQLLQNHLRLGFCRRIGRGIGIRGHADQNVARLGLLRNGIVGSVIVVILLHGLLARR